MGVVIIKQIIVVVAVDRKFLVGCAVTLKSVVYNLAKHYAVKVYVLCDRMSQSDEHNIRRATHPGTVEFVRVHHDDLRGVLLAKNNSRLTYARLLLGDLLAIEEQRCIYLDTDIVVNRDLSKLWETDLQGNIIAAVSNGDESENSVQKARLGLPGGQYFNAGVLLIDLARWRNQNIGRLALSYCVEHQPILWDQDGLNFVLHDRWLPLDTQWNAWASRTAILNNHIIHFTMVPKPWHVDYDGPHLELFDYFLDQTPYAGKRANRFFGLAPILAHYRRKVPYWPTVWRVLCTRLRR